MLSHFSRVRLFVAEWTVAHQAPLPMVCGGVSWSGPRKKKAGDSAVAS